MSEINPEAEITDSIECPLCLGHGTLRRAEVLQRLGMREFGQIAKLSAEEAINLLLRKEKESEQVRWARFETELTRRLADATAKHNSEMQKVQTQREALTARLEEIEKNSDTAIGNARKEGSLATEKDLQKQIAEMTAKIKIFESAQELTDERLKTELDKAKTGLESQVTKERTRADDLDRKLKDYLKENSDLRQKKDDLEREMAKVARVGKKEEMDFADEAKTWPGIYISEKLSKHGDYVLAYRDPSGANLDPHILVDNKDKSVITEGDVDKLIRDAHERSCLVAALVARDDNQLRALDKEARWSSRDGVWILRTTRQWFPRDLEVLKPLFETMRTQGPDFLSKNSYLADEVRRTFSEFDELEKQLKKAANAIEGAQSLIEKYRSRLEKLCEAASSKKIVARLELPSALSAGKR